MSYIGGAIASFLDWKDRRASVPDTASETFKSRLQANKGCFLRSLEGTATDNSTPIYRLADTTDEQHEQLVNGAGKLDGFYREFQRTAQTRPGVHAFGCRPVDCVKKESIVDAVTGKTKTMEITYLKPTVTYTFAEVWERIEAAGRGLVKLGIKPRANVAIYQETCLEWLTTIYGIWSQNMVASTVYANLGEDALAYALHETSSAAIVCGGGNASRAMELMKSGRIPTVPIIHVGPLPAGASADMEVYSFEELIEMGREAKVSGSVPTSPGPSNNDDLALIMYTSGTTGDPKGVMHTHTSLAAGALVLSFRIVDLLGAPVEQETYCVYLPLAHIMEFTVVNIFISRGAFLGFGSPRTLTDATARPHGDLATYKPNIVVGVPRIFDTLRKAVEFKRPPAGTLKRAVFDRAYASRLAAVQSGKTTPVWNEKVFTPIRQAMGGNVRMMLAGGGPISTATQEFVKVVFGDIVAGYGMTETVCVGVIQLAGDRQSGVTGVMEPGVDYKLVDTEHYKHTDKPEPRGELCLRGAFLFKGYYKQPELTKEALDEEGWFHTGDVAALSAVDGQVKIVGRVKALAKNSLGEYIAMEALEAVHAGHPLVLNNCVLVNPNKNYICAVVVTDESKATAFARDNGIEVAWPQLLESAAFQSAAAKSIAAFAKANRRASFECVRHVCVVADDWTPENDILTAAMKLKRRSIETVYAKQISALFIED